MCDRDCLHVRVNGDCGVGEDPKHCQMFIDMAEYEAHVDKLMADDENSSNEVSMEDSPEFDCLHCLYASPENCSQCYGDDADIEVQVPF